MTPKEKAIELFEKYDNTLTYLEYKTKSKQCALIAIEMSIEEIDNFNRHGGFQYRINYLEEVKKEIEKL
jgi:hypothetical protein